MRKNVYFCKEKKNRETSMKRRILWACVMLSFVWTASAQKARKNMCEFEKHSGQVMQAFSDSLKNLRSSYDAHIGMWEDLSTPAPAGILPNHNLYKLFVPPTYYFSPVQQAFGLNWAPGKPCQGMNLTDSVYRAKPDTLASFACPSVERSAPVDRYVNRILLNYYLAHPDRVVGNELYLQDVKVVDETQMMQSITQEDVKDHLQPDVMVENVNADAELVVVKPNFWKYTGGGKIQFTQHSVSDNWYKGGESTNALYSELILAAKYDDQHRIQFENELEMKLGFITAPSDTIHEYKTNSDLLRFNSKLGVKAFKNWYYTLNAELKTQFFPNYKTNSNDMVSGFMSPFQLKVSLGMDYKLSKKNFELSILGAPLTYKYVYLKDKDIVNPSAFEVEAGKSCANLFGSEFKLNMTWKIASNIEWKSKLEYFTTYEKVNISWENTFDFRLNRYLSTSLFIHPRFDDGVKLSEDNDTYFQFKEMFTFGLSYSW
jgi:hypothetical protein